ncbi:unnamed protein product, partial [Didymodactylos carnosus]
MMELSTDVVRAKALLGSVENKENKNGVKKQKGVFNKDWLRDPKYSEFLLAVNHDESKARCSACNKDISVHAGGKSDLDKHVYTVKHQDLIKKKQK